MKSQFNAIFQSSSYKTYHKVGEKGGGGGTWLLLQRDGVLADNGRQVHMQLLAAGELVPEVGLLLADVLRPESPTHLPLAGDATSQI